VHLFGLLIHQGPEHTLQMHRSLCDCWSCSRMCIMMHGPKNVNYAVGSNELYTYKSSGVVFVRSGLLVTTTKG